MKKLSLVFVFLLLQIIFVHANSNISFIDIDKILSDSKPGQSILKQLNVENNVILKDFEKEEKKLKDNEKKLISQKKLISTEDFDSKLKKLRLEINQYNERKKKKINDFQKLKINSTNKFLKLLNPILIEYSEKNSIPLILHKKNLIIGKAEFDITEEILIKVNSDMIEFKIK